VFLHALVEQVWSMEPSTEGDTYLHGWVERPAYTFAGGIERSVMDRLPGAGQETIFAQLTSIPLAPCARKTVFAS